MSLLLAGVAGAARGAGQIAEKYIDQEFEQVRAENLMRLENEQWNSRREANRADSQADYERNRGDQLSDDDMKRDNYLFDTQSQRDHDLRLARLPKSSGSSDIGKEYRKALLDLEGKRSELEPSEYMAQRSSIDRIFGVDTSPTGLVDPTDNPSSKPEKKAQVEEDPVLKELREQRLQNLGVRPNPITQVAKETGGLLKSGWKALTSIPQETKDRVLTQWQNGKTDVYGAKLILEMSKENPEIAARYKDRAIEILELSGQLPEEYKVQ